MKPQSTWCGIWRVDNGFSFILHIKNSLIVAPITVQPSLFFADGTEYPLPAVNLPVAGTGDVDVNAALMQLPPALAAHRSDFGTAVLRFDYPTPGHVIGSTEIINPAASLIFTHPFAATDESPAGEQVWEGLWWKHDPGVGGFVALSNVTGAPQRVTITPSGQRGTPGAPTTITLASHASELIDLDRLIEGLPQRERNSGGLRIVYDGFPKCRDFGRTPERAQWIAMDTPPTFRSGIILARGARRQRSEWGSPESWSEDRTRRRASLVKRSFIPTPFCEIRARKTWCWRRWSVTCRTANPSRSQFRRRPSPLSKPAASAGCLRRRA